MRAHFGNSDVAVVLSWRAIPLQRVALSAWAAALRASPLPVSTLRIRGALLGVLWKLADDGGSPPFSVALDGAGAIVFEHSGETLDWEASDESGEGGAAALPYGVWADARRLRSHGVPRVGALETDPPAMDNVVALEAAGFSLEDEGLEAPMHASLRRAANLPRRNGAAFLCGHVAFRRIAAGTPFVGDLCGADAVTFP